MAFVLDRNGSDVDFYDAFIRAAVEVQITTPQITAENKPAWQTDLDLGQIIRDKIEAHREKGLFYRGAPSKRRLAIELLEIINANEVKKGRRRIGMESVRNLLKGRKF